VLPLGIAKNDRRDIAVVCVRLFGGTAELLSGIGRRPRYLLLGHAVGSYGIGVPVAILSGFILRLSVWGIFGSRALEEVLKTIFFLMRYGTPAWYKKSVDELQPGAAKYRVARRESLLL
jgi:Na+-driven multidrug efflux pump